MVDLRLADVDTIARQPPEQSYVYDADGNQLAVLRREFRERVSFERIPRHLIDAVVVAEDKRFWRHGGVDARAIVRAALANIHERQTVQGGSTITQQLVKNLYFPDEPRTPRTKFREMLLSMRLEDDHPKEQILEDYLNTVYFGNGAYGVQAAAQTYFRADVADLTLGQAAFLAGCIRSPEAIAPETDAAAAVARRDRVLRLMRNAGVITRRTFRETRADTLLVQPPLSTPATTEPHWVGYVVRTLLDDPSFGATATERASRLYGGGLRIYTTLRPAVQQAARDAAARFLPDPLDPEVAIASVEPSTGHVVALVGGRDFNASQFDLATQGRRQPGSTFKTFVLAAAISAGYRPETIVDGDQAVFTLPSGEPWPVRNFDGTSYGALSLDEATKGSVNAAYARLILDVGVNRVIAIARNLGITSPLNEDPAIALGGLQVGVSPLEMAAAYATLANIGTRVPVSPIDRIEDASGDVVWRPDRLPVQALEPSTAFVVTQMLRNVVEDGTGVRAQVPPWEVAGKTGTVQEHVDAWFVGYTTQLATAVWVGHPHARIPLVDIRGEALVTGGSWPARIFREFMTAALAGRTPTGFVLPAEHYLTVEIDPATGLLAAPWCPGAPTPVPYVLVPRATCPRPPAPPPPPVVTATPSPPPAPAPSSEPTTSPSDASPSPAESGTSPPTDAPTGPSPTSTEVPASPTAPPSPPTSPSASPSPTRTPRPSPPPESPSPSPSPRPPTSPSPAATALGPSPESS